MRPVVFVTTLTLVLALRPMAPAKERSEILARTEGAVVLLLRAHKRIRPHGSSPTRPPTTLHGGTTWLITHTQFPSGSRRVLIRAGGWQEPDRTPAGRPQIRFCRLYGSLVSADGILNVLTWEGRSRGGSGHGAFWVRAFRTTSGGLLGRWQIPTEDLGSFDPDPQGPGAFVQSGERVALLHHEFEAGRRVATPPEVHWGAEDEGLVAGVRVFNDRVRVGDTLRVQVLVRREVGLSFPNQFEIAWGNQRLTMGLKKAKATVNGSGRLTGMSNFRSRMVELPCPRAGHFPLSVRLEYAKRSLGVEASATVLD